MAGRQFSTGATRDTDTGKLDMEAFNSPLVDRRYAEFMHKHRVQEDGELRAGDNWQNGIPLDAYVKSATRHLTDWRLLHRGFDPVDSAQPDIEDVLCAIIFNSKGYLYEVLKSRKYGKRITQYTAQTPQAVPKP